MKVRHMACLLLGCLLPALLGVLSSCSNASSGEIPPAERELPDMVLSQARYLVSQDSGNPLVMIAQTMTIYGSGRDVTMQGVSFHQGNTLSGSCDSARANQESNSADLSGNVILMHRDGEDVATIEAQSMRWDGESRIFSCDGEVHISYSDGTDLRAVGFQANASENLYEFGQILEGTATR